MPNNKRRASRPIGIPNTSSSSTSPSSSPTSSSPLAASPPTSFGRKNKRNKRPTNALGHQLAKCPVATATLAEINKQLELFEPNDTNWFFHCVCGVYGVNYDDGRNMIRCDVCHVCDVCLCQSTHARRYNLVLICVLVCVGLDLVAFAMRRVGAQVATGTQGRACVCQLSRGKLPSQCRLVECPNNTRPCIQQARRQQLCGARQVGNQSARRNCI
jgi:hypothetical protein